MAIALPAIKSFLLPGLDGIKLQYPQLPRDWPKLYETKNSEMQLERNVIAAGLSVAAVKQDGEPVIFDNLPGERYTFNQSHLEAGLAYSITRQTIEDNLYKSQFSTNTISLRDAFLRFEQIYAADPFNNATTYTSAVSGDGKALCATDHPVDGGSFSNLASPAASLNEAALNAAQTAINANFRDPRNNRMNAKPKTLLIGPQLESVAIRLTKTELRTGTANNDVSTVQWVQGGLPGGYIVWNYLTNDYRWFIMTDQPGMLHYNRVAFSTDMSVDFQTDSLMVKGRMRKSWGNKDPRAIYGSAATS